MLNKLNLCDIRKLIPNKNILVRADFNVPIKNNIITD